MIAIQIACFPIGVLFALALAWPTFPLDRAPPNGNSMLDAAHPIVSRFGKQSSRDVEREAR